MGNNQSNQPVMERDMTPKYKNEINTNIGHMINWNSVQGHRWDDSSYKIAVNYLKTNQIPSMSRQSKERFKEKMKNYTIKDGRLVIVDHHIPRWLVQDGVPISSFSDQIPVVYIVIKNSEIPEILESYLNDPLFTGFSRDALYDKVVRDKYIGITKGDVSKFLRNTDMIQIRRAKFDAPVVKSYRPLYPNQHWQMDLIDMSNDEIVKDNKGYVCILVIVDIFSKFLFIFPMMDKTSKSVSNYLNYVFLRGDIPKIMQTDDGAEFKNETATLLSEFNIQHLVNAPYHPQSTGIVENKNKQIKSMIHSYLQSRRTKIYYDILDRICFNINNTKHTVTKLTPFQIHRGYDINIQNPDLFNFKIQNYPEWIYGTNRTIQNVHPNEDTIDEKDVSIIHKYVESAKKSYDRRTALIKTVINRTADKRERSQIYDAYKIPLKIGDKVKIASRQNLHPKYQPIVLQLRDKEGNVLYRYTQDELRKSVAKDSKLTPKLFPDIFSVKEVVYGDNITYKLSTKYDKNGTTIEAYAYQLMHDMYSPKIYRNQIYHLKNIETEFIHRPIGGYEHVDPIPSVQHLQKYEPQMRHTSIFRTIKNIESILATISRISDISSANFQILFTKEENTLTYTISKLKRVRSQKVWNADIINSDVTISVQLVPSNYGKTERQNGWIFVNEQKMKQYDKTGTKK